MTKTLFDTIDLDTKIVAWAFIALLALFAATLPARASILTFDIFDETNPLYQENFPEGFGINQEHGDRIDSASQLATNGTTTFDYGVGAEGYTPNVTVDYGPFSIFTGGPSLWRYDYGDLERVLYQGSTATGVGNDYDILDIVFVADPGYDVVLYGLDLGGWFQTDYTIKAVTVYDGVPFPFLTPTNDIYEATDVLVAGAGPASTHVDFDGTPLTAHVIWLRIDASNLGATSELIGIDNIRFGQVDNGMPDQPPVDLAEIDAALQPAEVPEVASLVVWLGGLLCATLVSQRKTARVG
jgi:hypothetical protein